MPADHPAAKPATSPRQAWADETLVPADFQTGLYGAGGNDRLIGRDGRGCQLDGGAGDDTLIGADASWQALRDGIGHDHLIAGPCATVISLIVPCDGSATVEGGAADDRLQLDVRAGARYAASVAMGDGADALDIDLAAGARLDAALDGGAGDDRFSLAVAGTGSLRLTGGAGGDRYAWVPGHWTGDAAIALPVEITDFAADDRLSLDLPLQLAENAGWRGGNPFDAVTGVFSLHADGDATRLDFDADGRAGPGDWQTLAVFEGRAPADFSAANFDGFDPTGAPVAGRHVRVSDAGGVDLGGIAVFGVQAVGGAGDDSILCDRARDIDAGAGNDRVLVSLGAGDRAGVGGGAGDDSLIGGASDDRLDGGSGDDRLLGRAGADALAGGSGNDRLDGGAGNDSLDDGGGSDTLIGGEGDDVFSVATGGGERDVLRAGAGDDHIGFSAAGGRLVMSGGDGSDTWTPSGAALGQPAVITDFAAGAGGDRLDLMPLLDAAAPGYAGGNPFGGWLRLVARGDDTLLQLDVDGAAGPARWATQLVLRGVAPGALTADNFGAGLRPDGGPIAGGDGSVAGSPELRGGAGDDRLDGDADHPWLFGGAGDDLLVLDLAPGADGS
ncbi:calcium-binding protein [Derxia gummosa]|uniref:Calcium-binding protein n=1 Tax=Derxia gummosa DSM 723 TaxID=1121388 RepID=A0A8B6X3Q4_9BURK|nr:calcium-binding protein [Derxia gummosa]